MCVDVDGELAVAAWDEVDWVTERFSRLGAGQPGADDDVGGHQRSKRLTGCLCAVRAGIGVEGEEVTEAVDVLPCLGFA